MPTPRAKAGAVLIATASLALGLSTGPASADVFPQKNDVVGGGSDTLQFTADFLFDGTVAGDSGYNTAGNKNRVFSFDATADANGRAAYDDQGAQNGARSPLAVTSVLRAGQSPVVRPNGSGAGVAALYKGAYVTLQGSSDPSPGKVKTAQVDFARSSSLPSCTLNSEAVAAGVGGLRVIKFATEVLAMAVPTAGSNAQPALDINTIQKIYQGAPGGYTKWGDIPGYSGPTPNNTIIPLLPQSGSGTRSVFLGALNAAWVSQGNSGSAPLTNPNIQVVQENDYSALTSPAPVNGVATNPADTIAPFSGGRIGLNNSGYFGSAAANQVVQQTGGWSLTRSMYFVLRQSDVDASTGSAGVATKANTAMQPGGTKNFAQTLFVGTGSVAQSANFAANIQAAGQTPAYQDLGTPGVSGTSCS